MARVLVLRQVAHEGPGIMKRPLERDCVVEYIDVFRGGSVPSRIDGYDALIVLGGPQGVYEDDKYPFIKAQVRLMEDALKKRVPTLGICLGAQILAKAAGARVYKSGKKELGWYDVTLTEDADEDWLFLGFPEKFSAFHWHGDTFDVPAGSLLLASSDMFPNQVIKPAPAAYGIQFHLEVTEQMIREWVALNHEEFKDLKGTIDPQAILDETPKRIEGLNRLGAALSSRFIRMAEK